MSGQFAQNVNRGSDDDNFQSLVVIEFDHNLSDPTVKWILKKITDTRAEGGAELLACSVWDQNIGESVVHVGASASRLLMAAELMEIKKYYKDGSLREISLADIDDFMGSDDLDEFLTMAEKQKIILHELETVRSVQADNSIPGFRNIYLYQGEAIIARCRAEGIIVNCFPLHNKEELGQLTALWFSNFLSTNQLDQINYYFGEKIAMYYAFLSFYIGYLIPPAILGFLSNFLDQYFEGFDLVPLFCLFNLVWATILIESWKRTCAAHAYRWGTINMEPFEEARAQYYGVLAINKVTGRLEPSYADAMRYAKYYCVSVPVIIFSLSLALVNMLFYFWMEEAMTKYLEANRSAYAFVLKLVPTIVYTILVVSTNVVYRKIAIRINNWENHRLESEYENHLIIKLALFYSANCFTSLFYVAFYQQNLVLLRRIVLLAQCFEKLSWKMIPIFVLDILQDCEVSQIYLAIQLVTQQFYQQILDSVIPYASYRYQRGKAAIAGIYVNPNRSSQNQRSCVSEEVMRQTEDERMRMNYFGTLDDYIKMFLQFGYVMLFSSVFPMAAFWSFFNNITELRTDSFKMCRIFRRPFSRPTANIGIWLLGFEIISVVAVMTNCGLVYMSPRIRKYINEYGSLKVILVFFLIEHILIFIKFALAHLISNTPGWVRTALAAADYQAKQAWRDQRSRKAHEHLNQRLSARASASPTAKQSVVKRRAN